MRKTDAARLAKLNDLLDRLRRGETVQNRQLRHWLSDAGYKDYEGSWANVVSQRDLLGQKPSEIADYEALLKKATMLYNRAESTTRKTTAAELHAKAQTAFEQALMHLEEAMAQNPILEGWLDRHCDFGAGGNLSLDPAGMPRAITSRSLDNQHIGASGDVRRKRGIKIKAVENEIERINNPTTQPTDSLVEEKLRALKALRRR